MIESQAASRQTNRGPLKESFLAFYIMLNGTTLMFCPCLSIRNSRKKGLVPAIQGVAAPAGRVSSAGKPGRQTKVAVPAFLQ